MLASETYNAQIFLFLSVSYKLMNALVIEKHGNGVQDNDQPIVLSSPMRKRNIATGISIAGIFLVLI